MDEVSKTISAAATAAIMKLSKHGSKEQKEHFAEMLTMLAACYDDERNQRAVIIMSNDEVMATLSINADPWDTAGMVSACYDRLNLQAFQKMPEHYQAH